MQHLPLSEAPEQPPDECGVFFACVPPDVPLSDLVQLFSTCGRIVDINLYKAYAKARVSKGCGIVVFATPAEANNAIQRLRGQSIWPHAREPLLMEPRLPDTHKPPKGARTHWTVPIPFAAAAAGQVPALQLQVPVNPAAMAALQQLAPHGVGQAAPADVTGVALGAAAVGSSVQLHGSQQQQQHMLLLQQPAGAGGLAGAGQGLPAYLSNQQATPVEQRQLFTGATGQGMLGAQQQQHQQQQLLVSSMQAASAGTMYSSQLLVQPGLHQQQPSSAQYAAAASNQLPLYMPYQQQQQQQQQQQPWLAGGEPSRDDLVRRWHSVTEPSWTAAQGLAGAGQQQVPQLRSHSMSSVGPGATAALSRLRHSLGQQQQQQQEAMGAQMFGAGGSMAALAEVATRPPVERGDSEVLGAPMLMEVDSPAARGGSGTAGGLASPDFGRGFSFVSSSVPPTARTDSNTSTSSRYQQMPDPEALQQLPAGAVPQPSVGTPRPHLQQQLSQDPGASAVGMHGTSGGHPLVSQLMVVDAAQSTTAAAGGGGLAQHSAAGGVSAAAASQGPKQHHVLQLTPEHAQVLSESLSTLRRITGVELQLQDAAGGLPALHFEASSDQVDLLHLLISRLL